TPPAGFHKRYSGPFARNIPPPPEVRILKKPQIARAQGDKKLCCGAAMQYESFVFCLLKYSISVLSVFAVGNICTLQFSFCNLQYGFVLFSLLPAVVSPLAPFSLFPISPCRLFFDFTGAGSR
ncbi:MAG: hypothetical protein NTV04_06300, partial [Deltaproteobacteria bacterium]|nr:hypothetical protein [Deltaproteobacteria bacterium]